MSRKLRTYPLTPETSGVCPFCTERPNEDVDTWGCTSCNTGYGRADLAFDLTFELEAA